MAGGGKGSGGATLVVSLRSKGLCALNTSTYFDLRQGSLNLAMEFFDIFTAFVLTIFNMSWSAWISIAVAIVTIAATLTTDRTTAGLEEIFPFFMYIILPLLIALSIVFSYRQQAAAQLAVVKSTCVAMCLGRPEGSGSDAKQASDNVQLALECLVADLHAYLAHKRPYARHFYLPYRVLSVNATHPLVRP